MEEAINLKNTVAQVPAQGSQQPKSYEKQWLNHQVYQNDIKQIHVSSNKDRNTVTPK